MQRRLSNTFDTQNRKSSVSKSWQSERELLPPEFDYRKLFESMAEGFASCQMIYDKSGTPVDFRYLYVNPAFARQTGLPTEQVVGRTVREVMPNIEPIWIETYNRIVKSGKSEHFENKVKSIGRQFEMKAWPTSEGCFAVVFDDITERKKIEGVVKSKMEKLEELSHSQEETNKAMLNVMEDLEEAKATIELEKIKDEAILASIGDGLIAIDKDGKVIVINEAGCKLLGFESHELLGKKFINVVDMVNEKGDKIPKNKRPALMAITDAKSTTTTTTTGPVYYYIRQDGTRFPVAITVTPFDNGNTIGAIEVFRDISREIEIDKAKSEFVSLASHQLRTPLGITKWYLEAWRDEEYFKKAPDVTKKYYNEVYKSNERVLSLVRDLLSVSRIDQGKVKNAPKIVDLTKVVKEVVKQMQTIAEKKKVDLQLKIQENKVPPISIDALRFREVIENLIINAIEYTEPQGKVDVFLNNKGNTILITVKDTGIGISLSDQKKLFTKFFRSEKAVAFSPEGSGLGLYVVKSYVEDWGGKVSVTSSEGKGSIFTVSLPISQK